jgi:hypothetical protein
MLSKVVVVLRIREVPGSKLGAEIGYSVLWFYLASPGKYRDRNLN